MIDDDLYTLATEELNSNKRREDLWARAIALAADDHDEARYLYTNLRVEELMRERDGESAEDLTLDSEQTATISGMQGSPEKAEILDPDDLNFDELPSDLTDAYEATQAETSQLDSTQSDLSNMRRKAEALNSELLGRRRGGDSLNETSATQRREQDLDSFGDSTLETEPLRLQEDGTYQHDGTSLDDDIDPLERTEPEGFSLSDNSLEMTAPDGLPSYVEEEPSHVHDPATTTTRFEPADSPAQSSAQMSAQMPVADVPAEETLAATTIDRFDAPIEPELKAGRAYTVVQHSDGSRRAVKLGKSWPALLFTLPWMIYKKLWGTALVYLSMAAALLFALVTTGYTLLDTGAAATTEQKMIFGVFALLAVVGLLYLPFSKGNQWVVNRLHRKGYSYHTAINAQTAKDALDIVRR